MEDSFGDLYHDEILPMEWSEPTFINEPEDDYYDEPYDYWNPVEQGMYDDDPNPYHGDY